MPASPSLAEYKQVEQEVEREARDLEDERLYLSDVLSRDISWSSYEESHLINNKQLGMFLQYDKKEQEEQNDLLEELGVEYAGLFLKCLNDIRHRDTVEYLLVLVAHMLQQNPSRASYFHEVASNTDAYLPFLRILTSSNLGYKPAILYKVIFILSTLMSSIPDVNHPSSVSFLSFLLSKLRGGKLREVMVCLHAFKDLLKRQDFHAVFKQQEGIKVLASLFGKETQNAQLLYLIGFNFWLLSYNSSMCVELKCEGVIRKLVQVLKTSGVEKVVRICLATLRNMLELNSSSSSSGFSEEMIGHDLLKVLDGLSKRKWKDGDILVDTQFISQQLEETIKQLSSFEIYAAEVQSGSLQWSPAHKNERFWRENIQKFEARNFAIVQKLIDCLKDDDDTVREVACFDLGEFARFHDDGKRVVSKSGGKDGLMKLMKDSNPKVAKAALLAVQKLMVNNWEVLNKNSAAGVASILSKK